MERSPLKNIDYNLLVQAEKIRYQSDFSSAHWLHQVISKYERGITFPKIREAYECVLRVAINGGIKKAIEHAKTYPRLLGFPDYLLLENNEKWGSTQDFILGDFDKHIWRRFHYLRQGD